MYRREINILRNSASVWSLTRIKNKKLVLKVGEEIRLNSLFVSLLMFARMYFDSECPVTNAALHADVNNFYMKSINIYFSEKFCSEIHNYVY